jgi:hypothetical protein
MDNELAKIFSGEESEFVDIQSPSPSIDLTDFRLSPALVPAFSSRSDLYITSPISEHGYFEIQFHLDNNFWGIPMNFGNDPNGLQIRQGIAHLIDKSAFAAREPAISGTASAIDNPIAPSNGGLPGPNPCSWDQSFIISNSNCVVGAPGGTAYHISGAAGVNFLWQPALGSQDFCAAAKHFVNAGVASGFNPSTCVLTGISSAAASHTVNFFVRSDDPARLDLGQSMVQEICALFTGVFSTQCTPYLTESEGPITAFTGFQTSPTSVKTDWWIYTAGYLFEYPFDQSLYFTYNSRFVSGITSIRSPSGPCSSGSLPSQSAADYMYLCNSSYDDSSNKMEFAPCLSAPGDPGPGQVTPSFANCLGSGGLTAISAGYQAEDKFGQNAYTIPIFATSDQYGYLQNWQRVVNNDGTGIANTFTWLNAYSPNPALTGTIRQGFKQSTTSLSPYLASTVWDFYILNNIYDSLAVPNPLSNGQLIDWMTVSSQQLANSQLSYTPPAGTVSTFRFTLRSDMFWQDGQKVTSWDAKFSFQTLQSTGSFQGAQLAPMIGVTVLSSVQFDVNVNAAGPFTKLSLSSPTIFPGHLWSVCSAAIWNTAANSGNVPSSCMTADPAKLTATFDPLASGVLIGSGAWQCGSVSSGNLGRACSSTGVMNPPISGSYSLTRFGKGFPANSPAFNIYFRSAGTLALWIWTRDRGAFTPDFVNFTTMAACFNLPVTTMAPCAHFQTGIGATNGTAGPPAPVAINQILEVNRFVGVNWISPFNWDASPPVGLIPLPPVLREGGVTLNPCTIDSIHGYDC